MTLKETFGSLMVGRKARFKCDCLLPIDVTGVVSSFHIESNEIVIVVTTGDRTIKLYENHPNLLVEFLD